MKIYTIGEFAKLTGYATQTLRNWDNNGTLIPYNKSKSGKRFYSQKQLDKILGISNRQEKIVIGYCRVSSSKQKDDLERQVENMRNYLIAQGQPFEIITDVGSGINYNNKGLKRIISMLNSGTISKVVVIYKDRLVRFGFEIIEYLAELNDATIEIIEPKKESKEEELVTDLIQIVTVFSARLQGSRANRVKKIISELKGDFND